MSDVQSLALNYLSKNRAYIQEQLKSIGADEAAPTAQQDAGWLRLYDRSASTSELATHGR